MRHQYESLLLTTLAGCPTPSCRQNKTIHHILQSTFTPSAFFIVHLSSFVEQQVATFFRSRAEIEEKYARSLVELTRTTGDTYSRADCKAG